jgi:hypothetical protein
VKVQIEKELPKMAGAQLDSVSLEPSHRSAVEGAIGESFLSGFRLVVLEAAVLALLAAGCGAGIGEVRPRR